LVLKTDDPQKHGGSDSGASGELLTGDSLPQTSGKDIFGIRNLAFNPYQCSKLPGAKRSGELEGEGE